MLVTPLCARCKKVPPEEGRKRCRRCLDYEAASVRKAHQNLKDRGGMPGKPGRPRKYLHAPSSVLPLDGC